MLALLGTAFSWITGNSNSANKAMSAVDALVYTDEEKAVAGQKILDFKIEYAKATQGQSVARRVIAVVITAMWACLNLLSVGLELGGLTEKSGFIASLLENDINPPFMIVIGFYFLAHVVKR